MFVRASNTNEWEIGHGRIERNMKTCATNKILSPITHYAARISLFKKQLARAQIAPSTRLITSFCGWVWQVLKHHTSVF